MQGGSSVQIDEHSAVNRERSDTWPSLVMQFSQVKVKSPDHGVLLF